mgnify:CR=1 FL=1
MRRTSRIYAGLAAAVVPLAAGIIALAATPADAAVGGSGPYPADYETSAGLANHTIYRPANLQQLGARKLPVLAWGNGGCRDDGASARAHLTEIGALLDAGAADEDEVAQDFAA